MPSIQERKSAWLRVLNVSPTSLSKKRYYVCDLHFLPEDHGAVTIKRTAIPSLHLNVKAMQCQKSKKNSAEIYEFNINENDNDNTNEMDIQNSALLMQNNAPTQIENMNEKENSNEIQTEIQNLNEIQTDMENINELLIIDKLSCNCMNFYNRNETCEGCVNRLKTLEKYRKMVNEKDKNNLKLKKTIKRLKLQNRLEVNKKNQLKKLIKKK